MGRIVFVVCQDHELQFPAEGLGALRRPAASDKPASGAVLAAGHHLGGGRWQDQNFAIFLNKGDVSGNMKIFNLTLLAKIV